MKSSVTLFPLLALGSFAFPHDRRQASGPKGLGGLTGLIDQMSGKSAKPQKSFKIEKLSPSIPREGVQRMRIWYGPYTIRAANSTQKTESGSSMDPAGTGWSYFAEDFPKDITLLRSKSTAVYEDGTRAQITNGLYNHHLVFTNLKKSTPAMAGCDSKQSMARNPMSIFIGGSEDQSEALYTTTDGKFNSGYYIGKDDPLLMSGDIVNYTNDTKVVYTRSDIEFVQGKVSGMLEVSNQVLNVGMCDSKPGLNTGPMNGQKQFTFSGKEMTVVKDGYILNARGHLHDGGVDILMKVNGKDFCRSTAEYGGADATVQTSGQEEWKTISKMTDCDGPFPIQKGDKITLEAHYDLEKHPARKQVGGGMAETMALNGVKFAYKAD